VTVVSAAAVAAAVGTVVVVVPVESPRLNNR
jgi:hypothetical protein